MNFLYNEQKKRLLSELVIKSFLCQAFTGVELCLHSSECILAFKIQIVSSVGTLIFYSFLKGCLFERLAQILNNFYIKRLKKHWYGNWYITLLTSQSTITSEFDKILRFRMIFLSLVKYYWNRNYSRNLLNSLKTFNKLKNTLNSQPLSKTVNEISKKFE